MDRLLESDLRGFEHSLAGSPSLVETLETRPRRAEGMKKHPTLVRRIAHRTAARRQAIPSSAASPLAEMAREIAWRDAPE